MTITEHPLSTHDGLQNALTWSYKQTIFYTTSCFNIFNTRQLKCTQPRSTETLNKINGFKAWHGHWFWLCFSGVSVTFTRFFWREKLSLQQKHKKTTPFWLGWKLVAAQCQNTHIIPYHSHMHKNAVPSFGSEILSCLPWGNVCSWIVTLKPTLDPYHLGKARVEFVTNDMWNNQTWYLCEPTPSRDFFVGSTVCCFDFRNTTTKLGSKVSESILLCLVAPSRSTTWDVECTVLDGGQQCSGVAGS